MQKINSFMQVVYIVSPKLAQPTHFKKEAFT